MIYLSHINCIKEFFYIDVINLIRIAIKSTYIYLIDSSHFDNVFYFID